jgi:hypothetical protein
LENYTRPIRLSFQLPSMDDILTDNILAESEPEIGFIFFISSPGASQKPKLLWKGTHFEPVDRLTRRQLESTHETSNASGRCTITGCSPVPKNPENFIIGHTHPKSMYTSESLRISKFIIVGPPSPGDVQTSITNGCPIQFIFSIEGIYVIEPNAAYYARRSNAAFKAELEAKLNSYKEYIFGAMYIDMHNGSLEIFNSIYAPPLNINSIYAAPAVSEENRNRIKQKFNDLRRTLVRRVLNKFNELFNPFLSMRFYLWDNNTGNTIPSHITISSLQNPLPTLKFPTPFDVTAFMEQTEADRKQYVYHLDKASLDKFRKIVNDNDILRPLAYIFDESNVGNKEMLSFTNGFGNRTAKNGNLERAEEKEAKTRRRDVGSATGKILSKSIKLEVNDVFHTMYTIHETYPIFGYKMYKVVNESGAAAGGAGGVGEELWIADGEYIRIPSDCKIIKMGSYEYKVVPIAGGGAYRPRKRRSLKRRSKGKSKYTYKNKQ